VNVDHQHVGWYQSAQFGNFLSPQVFEDSFFLGAVLIGVVGAAHFGGSDSRLFNFGGSGSREKGRLRLRNTGFNILVTGTLTTGAAKTTMN